MREEQVNCSISLKSLLNFQNRENPDDTVVPLALGVVVSTSLLFLYCFFGKLATDSYLRMGDLVYESNWQDIPVELQKYLILMIVNMQKPLKYHGFGIAVLDLITFTSVRQTICHSEKLVLILISILQFIRANFTFYMMFKTLITD